MKLWCIVPVKPFALGKSRLSPVLSDTERIKLNQLLFLRTLKTLIQVGSIENILVVTRDPVAVSLSRIHGVQAILEPQQLDLNYALIRATNLAKIYSAECILILPADLPFITPGDIEELISQGCNPSKIILSPDKTRTGTNAMMINPIGSPEFLFGKGSFARHCQQANKFILEASNLPSFKFDLDTPADYFQYLKLEANSIQYDSIVRMM